MKNQKKRNKKYSLNYIDDELNNTGLIPDYASGKLAEAISCLPEEIIDFIFESQVFLTLDNKTTAEQWFFDDFRFSGKKGFILLSDSLWDKEPIQIAFIIAHEVAHAFKNHNFNSYKNIDSGDIDGIEDTKKREKEAGGLATLWLRPHFNLEDLKKLKYKDCQFKSPQPTQ